MRKIVGCWVLGAGLFLLTSCTAHRKEYVIGIGERIHHDDFEYSVTNLIITRFLKNGNDTLHAEGMFYLVKFRTENNAKRAGHEWDNSIAYITDEKAGNFENNSQVQQYFENIYSYGLKDKYITPAGTADSTYLAFDLPFNVTKPYLKVKGRMLLSDAFNGALFRRVRIKLY